MSLFSLTHFFRGKPFSVFLSCYAKRGGQAVPGHPFRIVALGSSQASDAVTIARSMTWAKENAPKIYRLLVHKFPLIVTLHHKKGFQYWFALPTVCLAPPSDYPPEVLSELYAQVLWVTSLKRGLPRTKSQNVALAVRVRRLKTKLKARLESHKTVPEC